MKVLKLRLNLSFLDRPTAPEIKGNLQNGLSLHPGESDKPAYLLQINLGDSHFLRFFGVFIQREITQH